MVLDYLKNRNIDVVLITETWLTTPCNNEGYKLVLETDEKQGGGVAIVYKTTMKIREDENNRTLPKYEGRIWTITSKGLSIAIHVIYRPLDGNFNMFLDDFMEYLSLLNNTTDNICVGYFNIHVSDELDQNAAL